MNKEKQIEEMAKIIDQAKHDMWVGECPTYAEHSKNIAKYIYTAGYRKQSENMIEVFCKVGDTVYQTDGIRIYELEVFDVSLRKGRPYYETESIDFDNTAIGDSIFLTKEEAEAKMKGGENNA